jgi:hypothetical protein
VIASLLGIIAIGVRLPRARPEVVTEVVAQEEVEEAA